MGKPHPPENALLFIATLYAEDAFYYKAREILLQEFGDLLYESDIILWNHSEYYKDELGWPIYRRFISFQEFISPERISDVKLLTNDIEEEFSVNDKRKINLDPGYVTLSKVVLATTKNYAQRIYLGKGIYAEVTLFYKRGWFRPHEFTYRDYRSDEYIRVFLKLREFLKGG